MIDWLKLAIYAYGSLLVWDLYWQALEKPKVGEAVICAALGWPGAIVVWCLWNLEGAGCD